MSLRSRVSELPVAAAKRLGFSAWMARDAQRELLWWTYARYRAARSRRPLLRGLGIGWTSSGYAELLPLEVPQAGRGSVTVLVDASVVSPGTERARYLRLPNASFGLGMPGYAAAGVVVGAGRDVDRIGEGDRVAVAGAPHASVATVPARAAYAIPPAVPTEAAAMTKLATIAAGGLRRGELSAGERFCVLGAGVIGLLAQRLGAALGAEPAAVVARTSAKEAVARAGGAQSFLLAGADADAIGRLELPLVIDASGDPNAVNLAVAAAAPGGRVVLLGSPRGATADLPIEAMRDKRIELVGAHAACLARERERTGEDVERADGEAFLRSLAEGTLAVDDLLGPPLDPREPGLFYRDLARRNDVLAAYFDWTRLPREERMQGGHLLRPPALAGRGMDFARRPLHPRNARGRTPHELDPGDPFAGATGMLRIGLLGCGDVASQNAAAAVAAPNTRLVACFDPVGRLAGDIARRFDAQAMSSADAVIEHPAVDAVLLSVPHDLHAPLAIQCAAAGKHVIVEKPQAHTLRAALDMAAAAERAGVVLSVAFPTRYDPKAMVARRLIEAGALGEFSGSHVRLLMDKAPPYWVGGRSGRSPSNWRASRERAGGGILIMNLCHSIDLVRHLAGVEADELWAHTVATEGTSDVEDAVSVSVRFGNGAAGSIVGSSAARFTYSEELRLWGRDGHIAVEPDARAYTLRALPGLQAGRWQTFGRLPPARIRETYLCRLASAIDQGRAPDIGAQDGIAVQAFIAAAYRSSEDGRGVRPDDLLREARS